MRWASLDWLLSARGASGSAPVGQAAVQVETSWSCSKDTYISPSMAYRIPYIHDTTCHTTTSLIYSYYSSMYETKMKLILLGTSWNRTWPSTTPKHPAKTQFLHALLALVLLLFAVKRPRKRPCSSRRSNCFSSPAGSRSTCIWGRPWANPCTRPRKRRGR